MELLLSQLDIVIRKIELYNDIVSDLLYAMTLFQRKVNAALKNQLETLWHTTNIYLHPKIHEYAEKLASKMPGDLKVVIRILIYKLLYDFQLPDRLFCQFRK